MSKSLRTLRRWAISSTLFPETTLPDALNTLGFVQADPIRSPARAQDLILRQRVENYRIGDLDANYAALSLEEDYLYAYGFMPASTWQVLHPRALGSLTPMEQELLAIVSENSQLHPASLRKVFGDVKEPNAWGGHSKVSTRALERLHYRGLIRVAGRKGGIKLYGKANPISEARMPNERLDFLILLVAKILCPISEGSLRAALGHLRHASPELTGRAAALSSLIKRGMLQVQAVDQVRYVAPADSGPVAEQEDAVRFLAPFDPLVWDRRRFEHLWGWAYRFEAYTPPSKRKMGYYAMPLLWRDSVIGWVNVSGGGALYQIEPGFISGKAPTSATFRRAFEAEESKLRSFLRPRSTLG